MKLIRGFKESICKINGNIRIKSLAVNSYWIILDKVYTLFIGLFVTSLVARYFGPEKYGLFNYALSFVSLFSVLSTLGIETLSVKAIVEKKENEGTILGTSLTLRIIGGVLLVVISYSFIRVVEPNNFTLYILVLVLSLVMLVKSFDVIEYWIQAHHRAKVSSSIRMISFTISSILKIIIVIKKGTLIHYSIIYLVDAIIVGLFLYNAYRKINLEKVKWEFKLKYAKDILSQSWYIMLSGIMITLFSKIDQIMLGSMMPTQSELGIYSAAVKIATMWYFIPMAIITSFKPLIMNKNIDNDLINERTQLLYNVVAWVGIVFGIIISIFSNLIVSILYGQAYSKAGSILNISIWAGTFATLGSARSLWLISNDLQKYSLYSTFIGSVSNIILNYILIPHIGGFGAALATLITQVIVNVIVFLFFKATKESSVMIIKAFNINQVIKSIKNLR